MHGLQTEKGPPHASHDALQRAEAPPHGTADKAESVVEEDDCDPARVGTRYGCRDEHGYAREEGVVAALAGAFLKHSG